MKKTLGGLISLILLGLYVHLIYLAIRVALCEDSVACIAYPRSSFNDAMAQSLSVIGGLVSALVIAELALAQPGEAPGMRVLDDDASPGAVRLMAVVSTLFVLVWLGAGVAALLAGLYHPAAVPQLTTHGHSWLGLAVSAAYTYFGLAPGRR